MELANRSVKTLKEGQLITQSNLEKTIKNRQIGLDYLRVLLMLMIFNFHAQGHGKICGGIIDAFMDNVAISKNTSICYSIMIFVWLVGVMIRMISFLICLGGAECLTLLDGFIYKVIKQGIVK